MRARLGIHKILSIVLYYVNSLDFWTTSPISVQSEMMFTTKYNIKRHARKALRYTKLNLLFPFVASFFNNLEEARDAMIIKIITNKSIIISKNSPINIEPHE